MNMKLSDMTLVGWLLALATIALVIILEVFSGSLFAEMIPGASALPVLLAIPGLIIGVLCFALGTLVLRFVGLPVVRKGGDADKGSPGD
jgi:hypothetical protein